MLSRTIRLKTVLIAASTVMLMVGCKSKQAASDDPATGSGSVAAPASGSGAATASGSGSAAQDEFPLAAGETYFGGGVMATNLVNWEVADGTIVQLGIVTTGKSADGRETGVLRAYHAGSSTHDVDQQYSLDPSIEHWAELKLVANNRVLFRHGEAGKGPRARNGVLLRWDAEAKRVMIARRWTGISTDEEPAWFATGEVTAPAPETEKLCLAVIAKMVACEKDPKFRSALFHRDDPAARTAMQEHFDTHVVQWRKPAEAKAQCQKWASGVYVDTSFSEKVKLERLAAENKHACHFFAAEIVDEGGLPVALTDAKPQRI